MTIGLYDFISDNMIVTGIIVQQCPHAMWVAKKNKSNVRVDKQNNCLLSNTAVKNFTKWWLMLLQQAVKITLDFSDILTERSVTFKPRLWKAQSARLVNIYFQGSTL